MLSPIDKDLSWIDTARGEYFYTHIDARAQEMGINVKKFAKLFGLSFYNLYTWSIEDAKPNKKTREKAKNVFTWLRQNATDLTDKGGPCLI